jgi:large subunit ribosomal protein L30
LLSLEARLLKKFLVKGDIEMLKITLVKSTIGAIPKHRKTVQALGLNKLHSTVEQQDNAAIRGMLNQVKHLVKVEEI